MLLLVGLGNPGKQYARHRHNVGFMAVDAIGDAHGFDAPRRKFQGELREGFLNGPAGRIKTLILKPQTYMNDSGLSVREAAQFYKIDPGNVIVFYDELDVAPGKVKAKIGGGAAGHNGIRSIDAHLGNAFRRIRIGIGHPGTKSKVHSYVLGDFSKADQTWLAPLLEGMAASAPFLTVDNPRFLTALAERLNPSPSAAKTNDAQAQKAPQKSAKAPEKKAKPSVKNITPDTKTGPMAEALQKLLTKKE